jgi:hypothetical protein
MFLISVVVVVVVVFVLAFRPTVQPADTSSLKTGDLVLFSSSRKWTRMFLRFTHVGMIIVLPKRAPFILEIHQKGDVSPLLDSGRLVMYDFWERVHQYPGRVYVAPLRNEEVLGVSRSLDQFFNQYEPYEYYDKYASHFIKKCIFGMPCKKPPHLVYCSELIGRMLGGFDNTECLTPAGLLDLGFHDRPRVVMKTRKMEPN